MYTPQLTQLERGYNVVILSAGGYSVSRWYIHTNGANVYHISCAIVRKLYILFNLKKCISTRHIFVLSNQHITDKLTDIVLRHTCRAKYIYLFRQYRRKIFTWTVGHIDRNYNIVIKRVLDALPYIHCRTHPI